MVREREGRLMLEGKRRETDGWGRLIAGGEEEGE